MNQPKFVRKPRPAIPGKWILVLLAAFMVAALITAYLTFIFVRSLVASLGDKEGETPLVEGVPQATAVQLPEELLNSPLQPNSGPAPEPWDGNTRVNILVMGLDYRDWEDDGPSRTDSMLLFTIDPESRSAGMLSIPRDLWVNIPGYDYGKINTAYFLGEAYEGEGGGPALAIQTVEEFLGVPVNYYAQIDFNAFVDFIDEIGGIEVDVPEEIFVDPIGPHNTVFLEPGRQLLDGEVALAYARSRNSAGNDFDRAARQQQVVLAVRDKILSLDMLPILIQKSPILYSQLASGVHTNLTLQEIISLAWLAQQVPAENIRRGVIGPDQVVLDMSYDGQSILRPIPEEIFALRDEIFTGTGPIGPAAPTSLPLSPEELRAQENATVAVLNGTFTAGLATYTTEYLKGLGVNVIQTGNALEAYEFTTIIDYSGKIYTQQYLVELFNVDPANVFSRYDANSEVDFTILVGNDWASNNPMP